MPTSVAPAIKPAESQIATLAALHSSFSSDPVITLG
jgi:hypothetical protein